MYNSGLLSHFFPSTTFLDVFLYFVLNAQEETQLARVVDGTGKVLIQVQRAIKRLLDTGLIVKTIRHKKSLYKINDKHIAYDEIRQLTIQAKIFSEMFEEDILKIQDKVDFGFIYGSVAKGSNTAMSDIDIFIVGNATYSDMSSFIFNLGRELAQEVNVTLFTPQEFSKQITHSFVTDVLQGPKIWLFGEKREFEEIYK